MRATPLDRDRLERLIDRDHLERLIDRETDLLSHRTSWLVASQAILFCGYANAVHAKATLPVAAPLNPDERLVQMIPLVALGTLVALYVSAASAIWSVVKLRREEGERVVPRRLLGNLGPLLMPAVFLVAWIVLLVHPG
jgi:hypothetical protein